MPNSIADRVEAPEAIAALPLAEHPYQRYFAGRNARPESLNGYRRKIRTTQRLLIEAGMDPAYASLPDLEFPWHCVDQALATRFTELLLERYKSAKSRENLLGIVRSMVRLCADAGLVTIDRRERVLACLPVGAGPRERVGREITPEEMGRLLVAAAEGPGAIGLRDAAILAVFYSTGVRISELIDLDISDLNIEERRLAIRRTKGGAAQNVWLHRNAMRILQGWIEARGTHAGALFHAIATPGIHLHSHTVRTKVKRAALRAGITPVTPHDFRRTFITTCLRNGYDPLLVARLVGHVNVATTMVYDRRTDAEDRAAVEDLPFPSPFLGGGR
jgi:integrase